MAAPQASDAAVVTATDDPTAQTHYAVQAAISAALIQAIRRLWKLIDLRDLKRSREDYSQAVFAVTREHAQASAVAAAQNFSQMRREAGISAAYRPPPIQAPTIAQVRLTVKVATEDLWNAPNVSEGPDLNTVTVVQERVEGAVQKLVADTGRNEMLEAIEQDRYARGFARVTKPGACAFCRLMALRGAVYKTAQSAGEGNEFHPNCHCTIQPLFASVYEPPAHTREDAALYDEVTKNKRGSEAKQKAWRRAVEGRTDGPERRAGRPARNSQPLGFENMSAAELQSQAALLEALPDSEYRTKQLARVRAQIASI